MSLITPDLSGIVDGQVGDAVDWTTPLNTMINDYNGGITNDNISASAAIATNKLASEAWTSWTPTFSNPGSQTYTSISILGAKYRRIGSTIEWKLDCQGTIGGTPSSEVYFTAPVARKDTISQQNAGFGRLDNAHSEVAVVKWSSTSQTVMAALRYSDTLGNLSAGGLNLYLQGSYEAA